MQKEKNEQSVLNDKDIMCDFLKFTELIFIYLILEETRLII